MIPNEIKKLNGTYRADRDTNKDVNFEGVESMKTPTFLSKESKKNFKLLVEELGIKGYNLISTLDGPALTLLADAYGEYIEVSKQLEEEGLIIEDYNNRAKLVKKMNPLASHKRMLFNDISRMLKEFGMTPSSRNKVEFRPVTNNNDDWNF